jgi:multiple sugar transport system ATP-binding protein
VATAIGSPGINLIPVTILAADKCTVCVSVPDGKAVTVAARVPAAALGGNATLGIRPEHLHVDEHGQFEGAVELFERLGPLSFAHLGARGEAQTVVAQLPGDRKVTLGERLRVGVAPADARLFDADGRAFPLSP